MQAPTEQNANIGFLLIAVVGIALYYGGLSHIAITEFAHDAEYHIAHIQYMTNSHDWLARDNPNIKNPFFYALAAWLYVLAGEMHWDPWFVVRQLTLLIHLLYLFFSASIIKITLNSRRLQWLAFALITLWPVAFTFPARLSPDMGIGMCSLAVFYYLLRWHRCASANSLVLAFLYAGFSILFKVLGCLNLLVIVGAVAVPFLKAQMHWRALITPAVVLTLLFSLLCLAFTYSNPGGIQERVEMLHSYHGGLSVFSRFSVFSTFSLYDYFHILLLPTARSADTSFWSSYVATLFIGDREAYPWKSRDLLYILGSSGLVMFTHTFFYWFYDLCIAKKHPFLDWVLLLAVALPTSTLLAFRLMFEGAHTLQYASIRYSSHFIALFCVMFVKSLEWHEQARRVDCFRGGIFFAFLFLMAALALILMQCGIL